MEGREEQSQTTLTSRKSVPCSRSTIRMHATVFTLPISSHLPTWRAGESTEGVLARWQGRGCISPSLSVSFHALLSLSPSLSICSPLSWSFAFERALPVKNPQHMKANVRGKGRLWLRCIKSTHILSF